MSLRRGLKLQDGCPWNPSGRYVQIVDPHIFRTVIQGCSTRSIEQSEQFIITLTLLSRALIGLLVELHQVRSELV